MDRWLWAIRVCKTRSAATTLCRGGHVRVNGVAAKPSTAVRAGDRVEAVVGDRARVLEVVRVIDKRVGAAAAGECLADHSPPSPLRERVDPSFTRDSGAGRPTKRERRQLDRFRNR